MLLDEFDSPGGNHSDNNSASKYLLYNDPFMGMFDGRCQESDCEHYRNLAEKLRSISADGDLKLLFENYEKLARVLSTKATLGTRTRKAYLGSDKDSLKKVICDYSVTIENLKEYYKAFQNRWYSESKPQGFEVQDIRIGGLIQRLTSCKERLEQFVAGEITEIPELHEPVLEGTTGYFWRKCVSANVISHS